MFKVIYLKKNIIDSKMAFLKKERTLPNLILCGNPLPWTAKCKHFGATVLSPKIDICEEDIRGKNARYIGKNIELNQEFHFAHHETKFIVNKIYNSHYSGSPLWNRFGIGARTIESSYNRSVKIMLDLLYANHIELVEALTEAKHVKKLLISKFSGFFEKIGKSNKYVIKGNTYGDIIVLVGKAFGDKETREGRK